MNATNKHQHYGDLGLISVSSRVNDIDRMTVDRWWGDGGSRALWTVEEVLCCATDRVLRMGCRIGAVEAWRRLRFIPTDMAAGLYSHSHSLDHRTVTHGGCNKCLKLT
jgi:hypothetical protein